MDKELKMYKSKVEALRQNQTRDTIANNEVKNELTDNDRKNRELERDIKVLQKIKDKKNKTLKKLKIETEYEGMLPHLTYSHRQGI